MYWNLGVWGLYLPVVVVHLPASQWLGGRTQADDDDDVPSLLSFFLPPPQIINTHNYRTGSTPRTGRP